MARQETGARDGLANENVQVGIGLPGRGIEQVYWCQALATDPAIRRDPASLGSWQRAAEFASHGMTTLYGQPLARILQLNIWLREVEHAAIGVIQSGGEIGCQLTLQHHSQAAGVQIFSLK